MAGPSLRGLRTKPKEVKGKSALKAAHVAWTELVPYVHDIEERLTGIEKKQEQLLFLLSQIVTDVSERRGAPKGGR